MVIVTIIKWRREGRMSRSEVKCQHLNNICNFIFFVYDMMTILTCYDIDFGWMIPKYKHILTFTYLVHMTNQHSFVLKECIVISISDPMLDWLTARIFLHSKSIYHSKSYHSQETFVQHFDHSERPSPSVLQVKVHSEHCWWSYLISNEIESR